jgi:hypothetical protein
MNEVYFASKKNNAGNFYSFSHPSLDQNNIQQFITDHFKDSTIATNDQIKKAYENGASWCAWGWYKDKDNNNTDKIALPMQQDISYCGGIGLHTVDNVEKDKN